MRAPTSTDRETERVRRALAGLELYGDNFDQSEIDLWFEDEREGYYNLYGAGSEGHKGQTSEDVYEYQALAERHSLRWLPQGTFRHALGIGSAHGAELAPILGRSLQVTVLEPSAAFASKSIDGKPVTYLHPSATGIMPFEDESFDLIVCFSVLHHIPNVSTVIREMYRVLNPGGIALLREPTCSMGDWRQPRIGLTKRERGIPLSVFRSMIADAKFTVQKESRCSFSVLARLQRFIKKPIWTRPSVVMVDELLCRLPIWSRAYHAQSIRQKLRPTAVAFVLKKESV